MKQARFGELELFFLLETHTLLRRKFLAKAVSKCQFKSVWKKKRELLIAVVSGKVGWKKV